MQIWNIKEEKGSPRYLASITLEYQFWQRGYEVIDFSIDRLKAGEIDHLLRERPDEVMVLGGVGVVLEAIGRAGRPLPPILDFPVVLRSFLGRKLEESTFGEVVKWVESEDSRLPVHVKPSRHQKLFTGAVVGKYSDLLPLVAVPAETEVFVQEVLAMKSEWRATILRGQVINVAHYKGDPTLFPDPAVIQDAIRAFVDAPIGFAMDWAITEDGRTVLVEVNDGFALGNYGVRGNLYTAMLECRWRQLMGLRDNGLGRVAVALF